jgi:hypothetical protein
VGFELTTSHLLGRQVLVSFPKERIFRNYLYNLANNSINTISEGLQSLAGRPGACVSGTGEHNLRVSTSANPAGRGDKDSMSDNRDGVPRANRDMQVGRQGSRREGGRGRRLWMHSSCRKERSGLRPGWHPPELAPLAVEAAWWPWTPGHAGHGSWCIPSVSAASSFLLGHTALDSSVGSWWGALLLLLATSFPSSELRLPVWPDTQSTSGSLFL